MASITHHAQKRTKDRLGLPMRVAERNAERALEAGLTHKDTNGSLHRYLDALYLKHRNCNNVRVYCNNVYVFHGEVLITVLPLPSKYRKVEKKLRGRVEQ